MYLAITLCTGELLQNFLFLLLTYFRFLEDTLDKFPALHPYMPRREPDDVDEEDTEGASGDADGDEDGDKDSADKSGTLGQRQNSTRRSTNVRTTSHTMDTAGALSATGTSGNSQDTMFLSDHVDMNPSMSFCTPDSRPFLPSKNKRGSGVFGGASSGSARVNSVASENLSNSASITLADANNSSFKQLQGAMRAGPTA